VRAQSQDSFDQPIELEVHQRLPARLVGRRVPWEVAAQRRRRLKEAARRKGQTVSKDRLTLCDGTLLVTNIPLDMLTLEELFVLARLRWQIELLFKLWKSIRQIDHSHSKNPWHILCEFYAKLIGQLVQHWVCLLAHNVRLHHSFVKAAHTIRQHALYLVLVLPDKQRLVAALTLIQHCLQRGCWINRSLKTPRHFQLLLQLEKEIA
jgi:hypothetical protein